MLKQYLTSVVVSLLLVAGGASLTHGQVHAATLNFTPDSSEVAVDETFSVAVDIDAGTSQVAGTDIYIIYDSALVSLQSVTGGGYFPLVNNIPSDGRLYISGVVANQGEFKTGTGTVATLVFKALDAAETELEFECDLTKSDTSKIVQNDINASNIIDCSALDTHAVTIEGEADADDDDSTSASDKPKTLPESGVYEDMLQLASWGGLLLVAGFALRILMVVL